MVRRPIYINGRFLSKPITGTQRFAREIAVALDRLLVERCCDTEIKFIAPNGTPAPEGLLRIGFEVVGSRQGHAWEQFDLLLATHRGTLVNLVNSGPILHPRQFTVIHDAAVFRLSDNFSFAYRTLHRAIGRALAFRSRIGTVSEFSRQELAEILRLRTSDIPILMNGHEHILHYAPDAEILATLDLRERPYFLFVGSPAPNKNLSRAVEAFTRLNNPDLAFVIVGAAKSQIFGNGVSFDSDNVIMPGRLSDGQIVALYQNAKALVFPSLYEGFGIPPLEAMTLGCPVIASQIPPVKEVCGAAALYCDPLDVNDITAKLKQFMDTPELAKTLAAAGRERYPMFSWKTSAANLFEALKMGTHG